MEQATYMGSRVERRHSGGTVEPGFEALAEEFR
jgi:hypothetical protein